jgi:hypothetical protein
MALNRAEQLILGKGLGEVLLGTDESPSRAIKQSILARKHDDGGLLEHLVMLD